MSLHAFIHERLDAILDEWQRDAVGSGSPPMTVPAGRRQHFGKVLQAVADEMKRVRAAADAVGAARHPANAPVFEVTQTPASQAVADYASLRASVVSQWRSAHPAPSAADLDELVHFNAAMDRSLAELTTTFAHDDGAAAKDTLFLGVLNHELRTSVASILMAAQVLTHRTGAASPEGKAAQRIQRSCEHVRQTLDALSDFTKVQLGQHLQIERRPADMGVLCREAVDAFERAKPERRVRFEARGELGGSWDAERIREAIGGLLSHVARFALRGTSLALTVERRGDDVVVTVQGNGSPIDAGVLKKIFDAEARVEAEDSTYAGLGLGLFVVRKVVDAHGGRVGVDVVPERGTTFVVALPRQA
jgi:signal transduction histidine kinase